MARHVSSSAAGRRSRLLLVASLLLMLAGASALGFVVLSGGTPSGAAAGTSDPARSGVVAPPGASSGVVRGTDWVEVLGRLDARRSRAFAAADPGALAEVYADGSPALSADRRLLRRYADRGLRVTGLRMRVVDVRLLEAGDRHAVLRVRDRVAAGRVVGGRVADGGGSRALRDDTWSRHRVRLERADDGWRIAELKLLD